MAGLAAVFGTVRRRGTAWVFATVTSPSIFVSPRTYSNTSDDSSSSDASSFVDVSKAQERARMKAAAVAAQSAADTGQMFVFDRAVKAAQRDRAAFLRRNDRSGDITDPFLDEIAKRTLDRLRDVKRVFPKVLVLGGATDAVVRTLLTERQDVTEIVVVDASFDMLSFVKRNAEAEFGAAEVKKDDDVSGADDDSSAPRLSSSNALQSSSSNSLQQSSFSSAPRSSSSSDTVFTESHTVTNKNGAPVRVHYVHADEEDLPMRDASVDVVISVLGLHWANDLPGAMSQARQALVPDGLFLCSVLGGESLREMRIACAVGEMEREGGVSQRVSPLAQVRDCGNLLTRAGMKLPAVDVDTLTMQYPNPMKLVEHLRQMAEQNAAVARRKGPIRRTTAIAAAACYQSMFCVDTFDTFGDETEKQKKQKKQNAVECTFQVLYMTGWSPGANQPEPLERGSADVSLAKLEEELAKVPGNK
jgi:NADH dehydrogenase [ubiquinone] 1 alpha subcomplex assembly factor 5|tara:strand:+ start:101 stop:1522 length:1422 start_codon:yes stop_codon:yes gene_type:complete